MIIVFVGPTLGEAEVRAHLPAAVCQGPAQCGDIYRAVKQAPRAIALIDGYFDHQLSVWHKEILWALWRGIRVYGSSSMGALRAAELASFGMIGVGKIYEWYATGVIEDDDEVAVAHESAERGFASSSDAMVNFRATLSNAQREGVLTAAGADALTATLKGSFYPTRDSLALKAAARRLLPASESEGLISWVEAHGISNQKKADAIELLARLREGADEAPDVAKFAFEYTDAWERLCKRVDAEAPVRSGGDASPQHTHALDARRSRPSRLSRCLERLRERDPALHARAFHLATRRALSLVVAEAMKSSIDPSEVQQESEHFRRERGLVTPEQTSAWLERNQLSLAGFSELIHDTVLTQKLREVADQIAFDQMPNVLRLLDSFDGLEELEIE